MKLLTPFDYWRAGYEMWLSSLQAQLALNEQIAAIYFNRTGPNLCAPRRRGHATAV